MSGLILFDWDGTLVDSMPSIVHTTKRFFSEGGHPEPEEHSIREAISDGRGLEFFLRILHPAPVEEHMSAWMSRWREIYDAEAHPHTRPYHGALEAVAALAEAGCLLAVVSNKGQKALERSVGAHGFTPYLELVVGDEPGQPKKPAPEMFSERMAHRLPPLDPTRTIMVGDSESDLLFGKAIGGRSCFAAYGYGHREACLATAPEVVVTTAAELAALAAPA